MNGRRGQWFLKTNESMVETKMKRKLQQFPNQGVLITLGGLFFVFVIVFALANSRNPVVWASLASSEEKTPNAERPAPDNSACFVCHANFEDESLSARHFKAKIGCVDCHGESVAHRSDENNTTPPDRMYSREDIEPACKQCHNTHNASPREVVEVYLQRCQDVTDPKKLTCTNCHGRHRMNHRTIIWDKRTGKIVPPNNSAPVGPGNNP